jgi:2-keto-myo-inositol isomerase
MMVSDSGVDRLCINPATTMTSDLTTDVRAYATAGFRAMELWLPKVERYLQDGGSLTGVATLLADHGLQAAAADAGQENLLLSQGTERRKALDVVRRQLEILQATGCPVFVVPSEEVPQPLPCPVGSLYELAAANFAEACDVARPYGVSLALEFVGGHGTRLVATPLTAQELVLRCGRENAGVVFDTFLFYTGCGKMEDIQQLNATSLLIVHVNDAPASVPREALADRDRVLPGDGVFPLAAIFEHLERLGYSGRYSCELFNEELWSEDPVTVAQRAYSAMVKFVGTNKVRQ